MAFTFVDGIGFNRGEMFYFGSFSYIADESGALHHIADTGKETRGICQQLQPTIAPR